MKILCPCGAKFAVDVTPEMAQTPVQFVCPVCGLDSSAAVNLLIQQELAASASSSVPTATQPSTATASVAAVTGSSARIHVQTPAPAGGTVAEPGCFKHQGQPIAHHCMVCNKPMCLKCMEMFGYVCSPFCKTRAESRKMHIPVYAGQKSVTESRLWRKVGLATAGIAAVVGLLIGAWVWYAWFGSRPRPFFTVKFPEEIKSGESHFCSKDQLVFRRGMILSRYDLKQKKEVWSRELISKDYIETLINQEKRDTQALIKEATTQGWERIPSLPSPDKLREMAIRQALYSLELFVQGSNIWVISEPGRLAKLDWSNGNAAQEVQIPKSRGLMSREGGELTIRTQNELRQRVVTHVDLASGTVRSETFGEAFEPQVAAANGKTPAAKRAEKRAVASAGLPVGTPGANRAPMDPARVASEAQRLPLAGRIALPATVGNALNQERILNELDEQDNEADVRRALGSAVAAQDSVTVVSSRYGSYGFAIRMLEEKFVERMAMKAPPKKSALDGNVNATQTMEIANELLNEMQRNRGGDKVIDNESRYLVTVHGMESKAADWSGEVVGPPKLISLKTVTLITGGSSVVVLDKSNKKLWQATLSQKLPNFFRFSDEDSRSGQFPCAEQPGRLYVCDQAMLTAFELNSGNVIWRLPSVGISRLMFDEKGMLYVNTTTASPDSVKYSRQIDVTKRVNDVIMKVDPAVGKTLWSTKAEGSISYLSGKFIYISSWNDADDLDERGFTTGFETPSYVRIKRLNPDSGELMWDYYQPRAALDVKFNENIIQIVFKKEMQVLKYLTF